MPVPRERWAVLAVFVLAVALRLHGLGEWSLWEDEETTIYFSYHPTRAFARAFPTFFLLLGQIYRFTGCSVLVGRLLAAAIGIMSLALIYAVARRFAGSRVALVALLAVSVSPGHLFWSQSIRYYGLVICMQLISIWLFLEGLRRQRAAVTATSVVPIALAMTCHSSAVLMVPVPVVYLAWLAWRGRPGPIRVIAICFLAALAVVVAKHAPGLRGSLPPEGAWVLESARNPSHLLITAAFYFGPPALALAAYGVWNQRAPWRDEVGFFALLAVLPVAALVTLAVFNVINVTYYYGLISLVGVAVLAGYGAESVGAWRPRARWLAAGLAALYYFVVLGAYYGPAFGDRPRWREAAHHVALARSTTGDHGVVYAQVPGVLAFYLGVPPSETMGHPSVRHWSPLPKSAEVETWIIGEQRLLDVEQRMFVEPHCSLSARLPARMLFRDRTVVVYRCAPLGPPL